MKKLTFKHIFVLAIFLLFSYSDTRAQMNTRAMAMGGAFTALARGVHAPAWNPANLGLPDNNRFSFTFASVSAGLSNNAFNKGMYDRYFVEGADDDNNIYWTEQDVRDILNAIPDNGLNVNTNVYVQSLSLSAGRFALSFTSHAAVYANIEKTLFEIPLIGTEIGESYIIDDIDAYGLGYAKASLSWGQPLSVSFADAFSIGWNLNVLYGGGYAKSDTVFAQIDLLPEGIHVNGIYEASYAYLGEPGFGLDLGAAAQKGDKWTFGISFSNIIGQLVYKQNAERAGGSFSADSLSAVSDFEEDFTEDNWTEEGAEYTVRLPLIMRMGVSFKEGSLLLGLDYSQGFTDNPFVSKAPRFSFGLEYTGLSFLPVRTGVVIGGYEGFGLSCGFGFNLGGVTMDFAILNRGGFSAGSSRGVYAGFELGIHLAPGRQR